MLIPNPRAELKLGIQSEICTPFHHNYQMFAFIEVPNNGAFLGFYDETALKDNQFHPLRYSSMAWSSNFNAANCLPSSRL